MGSFYLDFRRIHYPTDHMLTIESFISKFENIKYFSKTDMQYVVIQDGYFPNVLEIKIFYFLH